MSSSKRQFYLTLPSNSSTSYYPKNNAYNYTTHLPRNIHLDGDEWEVALVEAHFPSIFLTLGEGEYVEIVIDDAKQPEGKSTYRMELEAGDYNTVDELLEHINGYQKLKEAGFKFIIDSTNGFVGVENNPNLKVTNLFVSNNLALMLGVDSIPGKSADVVRTPDLTLNKPTQMYVYCDLVDPQLVGDTMAPLLRIVNINTRNASYGAMVSVHFTDPHYVPVLKSTFETVEIDLRNDKGYHLPFRFGTSCMKLHFRRVASATAAAASSQ